MDMRSFLSVKRPRVEGVAIYRYIDYANEEAVPSLGSDWLDDTVSQPAHHGNFDPSRDSVEEYDEAQVEEEYEIDDVKPNACTVSRKDPPEYRSRVPSDKSRTACKPAIVVERHALVLSPHPKHVVGQHSWTFRPKWAVHFKWVEYSLLEDNLYCHLCLHFEDCTLCT